MDNIRPRQSRPHVSPSSHRHPATAGTASTHAKKSNRNSGEVYWLVRSIGKIASHKRLTRWMRFAGSDFVKWPKKSVWNRAFLLVTAVLFVMSTLAAAIQPMLDDRPTGLSAPARAILPKPNPYFGQMLQRNAKEGTYDYNMSYAGEISGDSGREGSGSPRFGAVFNTEDPSKGVKVKDSINNIEMTLKPKFNLHKGKKEDNQLIYRLGNGKGYLVYTAHVAAVKEDVVLERFDKDRLDLAYELGLEQGLKAKLESDGSLGIYGSDSPLAGNVSIATDEDAKLLEKARQNLEKNKLLFRIPAPEVIGPGKSVSSAKSHFELDGNTLTVVTEGLKNAAYPLSIDPSVYVETAQKLMRGNNETNTDFDVDNELIQKSQTTGARIDNWESTNSLSTGIWAQGTAVAGGYIYSAGGNTGTTLTTETYYTAGSFSYSVPAGVTSMTVKAWGAGGGGGAGSGGSGSGGNGGGGGYTRSIITVTPSENLSIDVGSAGAKGGTNTHGGDGGGYSAVRRGGTFLIQAGGGGGGGGARGNQSGGAGGAGGGTSGIGGSAGGGGSTAGGGPGTSSSGGAGATTGTDAGNGVANSGGDGAASTACGTNRTTNGGAGGTGGGGDGGNNSSNCANGGGGGGGRFGGGGGSAIGTNNRGGGGGGGGSGLATGTGIVETAGSGTTPGSSTDTERNGAGQGGTGATTTGSASDGTAGAVVITYVVGTAAISNTVSWAKINSSTKAIESPNPGTGACSGWCTNSVYNLPVALKGLSLVAYNGYLYAIGGSNSSNAPQTNVYIAKLGANGEPQLWHPSGGSPVYWYQDTALSNARSYFGAVAYNNRLYILGGLTTSNTLLTTNTVQYANINPMGTLTAWTTTGMSALTSNRYGLTAQVYNDVLYVIGGSTSFAGAPITTVEYSRLNNDGTMNSWVTTSSLGTSGRLTLGGSFSTIWGAYIYVGGGCTAMNASGYCTAIASDVQLASINADGSLSEWNTILNLTNQRVGHTLISWQGGLYRLGGCRTQDGTSGDCTNTVFEVDYGVINQDGEASTVATSVDSGVSPCTGGSPTSCNLPSSAVGNVLNQTAIMNGYLYIMGGCTNNACTSVSSGITYQAIGSDGSLQRPATCSGTYTDSYCVSSISLPAASAAGATAIFNNRIYIVGGFTSNTAIYYTSVNTDGSLNAWSNADLTTIGAADVSYAYAYARANPSAASSVPGHLFIFGGCEQNTVGCSSYSDGVYKCNISTTGVPSGCTTTGQLQIGTATGASGSGLGAMAGTVYANYIYLMGGLAPGLTDLTVSRYARFDNNNNVVAVSGSAWIEGANELQTGRRRGAGFGYNGYLYVVGGYDGTTGVLADIEFAKINVSDGSWGPWSDSSVTINQRWGLTVPVSNSYAYVVGGCTAGAAPSSCTTRTDTIQTFQIYNNNSGTAMNYSTTGTCGAGPCSGVGGVDRIGASSTVMNGYVYYAGGCSDMTCTTLQNTVYYAPLDAYGNIGTWAAGGTLPAVRAWGKLVGVGGTLYYLGGQTTSATSSAVGTVYYTSSISGGNPTWNGSSATNGIGNTGSGDQARTQFGAAVWNNRIYITGGFNASSAVQSTVFASPSLSGGGNISSPWSSTTAFNVARSGHTTVAYANNLYVLGGFDGTNYLNDTQYTQVNTDGSVDAWTYSTSLPNTIRDAEGFAANGYIYLVGGRTAATTCTPKTLVAPVSANTTIATGNNPTGVGEWYETNIRYTGDRYGSAVSYAQGRIYVLGGGCSSFVNAADRGYYATLKSQPQVAKYSRLIDTDTDVFPNSFLMNGIDNSIGARWQTRYRSMHDLDSAVNPNEDCGTSQTMAQMTTWGQETNFGDTTLGTVNAYIPKDSAGSNINCARYYYFSISIDASQTFGYPEDVNRGPTITDLALFFTSDPSKRLRHGKTFTGGEQQPLDTPCRRGTSVPGDPNYNCPLP